MSPYIEWVLPNNRIEGGGFRAIFLFDVFLEFNGSATRSDQPHKDHLPYRTRERAITKGTREEVDVKFKEESHVHDYAIVAMTRSNDSVVRRASDHLSCSRESRRLGETMLCLS